MAPNWVCVIRHAQSMAQKTDLDEKELYKSMGKKRPPRDQSRRSLDPGLWDAVLSEKGIGQAKKLSFHPPQVDAILVSPLTRALETAMTIFEHVPHIPIIVSPLLTEIPVRKGMQGFENMGKPLRDLRNNLHLRTYRRFSSLDFSIVEEYERSFPDGPPWWTPVHSKKKIKDRIDSFLRYLQSRNENKVAIVGHCCWLMRFLKTWHRIPNSKPMYFPLVQDTYDGTLKLSRFGRYMIPPPYLAYLKLAKRPHASKGCFSRYRVIPDIVDYEKEEAMRMQLFHDLSAFVNSSGSRGVSTTDIQSQFGVRCQDSRITSNEFKTYLGSVAFLDESTNLWRPNIL